MKVKYLTERSLTLLLLLLVKKGEWNKIQQQNVVNNTTQHKNQKPAETQYSINLNHSHLL